MADHDDGTLNLEEVKDRFLRAEEGLKDLVTAGTKLRDESGNLAKAGETLGQVGSKVEALVTEAGGLIREVRQIVEILQQADPAVVLRRLEQLEGKLAEGNERMVRLQKALTDAVNRSTESMVSEIRQVRTVAIVAAALAAVAMVLAGLGLIL
jgi:uncharacterized phage infection (PIP) family protein YhgE